jgi:PKD repeat protein
VVVKPKLELVVSPDISTCIGTKVTLNAAGAKDLHWEPAGILSCENCSSPSFTASKTTTFKVTGFDGNCTTTDSVKVTVDPAQNADFITRVINFSVLFYAVPSGMTKYEWDLGDPAHTRREGLTFEYSYTRAGIYNVTLWVTGSCGTVEIVKQVNVTSCNNECE